MSGNMQQPISSSIPDASHKLDEDKYSYFESSAVDSGIHSGEIVFSGDNLTEESAEEEFAISSGGMRLDSGIDCLSDNLSHLSLKHENLNDLSSTKTRTKTPPPPVVTQEKDNDTVPWMLYYEQDEDGDTHLHLAIIQGFIEVSLALIRMAPTPRLLDTLNDDAQSPLHLAVTMKQSKVARWLIVAGARPDPRNLNGDSPLHIAARNGDIDCCRAILEPVQPHERNAAMMSTGLPFAYSKCNIDQWNYVGQTCVHIAAEIGQIDVLKYLVWYGADINAREGLSGYTALHYAVLTGNERLAQFLLSECRKLDPETVSYDGKSVLQLNRKIPVTLFQILRSRGVPTPYSSDDSEDEDYDEHNADVPMIPLQVTVAEALCH